MTHKVFIVCCLITALASCRKADDSIEFTIRGVVTDSRNGAGLPGVLVTIDEQVVEGGALNGSFSQAAQSVTGADGSYELVFQRRNALEYRVDFTKSDYFEVRETINPDLLNPEEQFTLNNTLIPEATLEMHFYNANPFDDDDLFRFRKLNALFECVCCNNDWIDLEGMDADTTVVCKLHGDYLLTYTYLVFKEEDEAFVDSVYCPAFHTTEIDIGY